MTIPHTWSTATLTLRQLHQTEKWELSICDNIHMYVHWDTFT